MRRSTRTSLLTLTTIAGLAVAAIPVEAQRAGSLFERLSGAWAGSGTVQISSGPERLRCRADYSAAGPTQLRLLLRCASDSINLQVTSDIVRNGDRLSGTWSEATFNSSGNLSGTVQGDRILGTVQGGGLSVQLNVTTRGNSQAVTLTSDGTISGSASVSLRRM